MKASAGLHHKEGLLVGALWPRFCVRFGYNFRRKVLVSVVAIIFVNIHVKHGSTPPLQRREEKGRLKARAKSAVALEFSGGEIT